MYLTRTSLHIRIHVQFQRRYQIISMVTQTFIVLSPSFNLSGLSFHRPKFAQPNSETRTNDHTVPAHPHPQAPTVQAQVPYPPFPNSTSDPSNPFTTQHVKPPPLRSITMEHSPSKHSQDKFRRWSMMIEHWLSGWWGSPRHMICWRRMRIGRRNWPGRGRLLWKLIRSRLGRLRREI